MFVCAVHTWYCVRTRCSPHESLCTHTLFSRCTASLHAVQTRIKTVFPYIAHKKHCVYKHLSTRDTLSAHAVRYTWHCVSTRCPHVTLCQYTLSTRDTVSVHAVHTWHCVCTRCPQVTLCLHTPSTSDTVSAHAVHTRHCDRRQYYSPHTPITADVVLIEMDLQPEYRLLNNDLWPEPKWPRYWELINPINPLLQYHIHALLYMSDYRYFVYIATVIYVIYCYN